MLTRRTVLAMAGAAPLIAARADPAAALVAAARRQIGVTTRYDRNYVRLAYPNGDVPRSTGVCADVVVRAARDAWGLDLQKLVHEDMGKAFGVYPRRWGLSGPDSNIDHRRVPNLETFWTRQGARVWHAERPTWGAGFPRPLLPGDILTWRNFMRAGPHVAIVSEGGAWPRIVQNAGWGTREDLLITAWLDGAEAHFRWRPSIRA
jgi:hypothetical protein